MRTPPAVTDHYNPHDHDDKPVEPADRAKSRNEMLAQQSAFNIIKLARKAYGDHEGDGAWIVMEQAYLRMITEAITAAALRSSQGATAGERQAVAEAWESGFADPA